MGHIRLLFLSVLLISGIILVVKAEEDTEEGSYSHHQHQNVHQLYQEDPTSTILRLRRDVLKGKDNDLIRSKRYIGRVPISYMKKIASPVQYEPYGTEEEEDDLIPSSSGTQTRSRAPSHFREFQMKNTNARQNEQSPASRNDLTIEEPKMLSAMSSTHRNQRRYIPNTSRNIQNEEDPISPLSDTDLQSLLLMIDGFELKGNNNNNNQMQHQNTNPTIKSIRPELYYTPQGYISPQDLERIAQMYEVGKRETGKRSPKQYELEQPMSFDNALYPGDRLEFLNDKRSKRIGARNLMAKTSSSNRFKKETDPAVLAILNKVFTTEKRIAEPSVKVPVAAEGQSANPRAATMDHQNHEKSKKSIDWSNYLGIDKRNTEKTNAAAKPKAIIKNLKEANLPVAQASDIIKGTSQTSSPTESVVAVNQGKDKESTKKLQEREENATENKEDQNWMLHEFYKNFAMSTNVKRKRESPSTKPKSDLEKLEELEKKMTEAGDKIIWDALKYGGAHRDEPMSPSDLAQVKNNIIKKLSTAYSLEKVREAMEELRQQIKELEERSKE